MSQQPTGYCSPKLIGRDVPSKGGRGVFASRKIRRGELLVVWGGELLTLEQLQQVPRSLHRLALQVEEGLYLYSLHEGPADWVNHSCNPSCGIRGQISLVAMHNMQRGEEVCFDYSMTDGSTYDEFDCECGALGCRGRVTAEDWRLPELQERYRGYFSPYLQRRIEQLQAQPAMTQG